MEENPESEPEKPKRIRSVEKKIRDGALTMNWMDVQRMFISTCEEDEKYEEEKEGGKKTEEGRIEDGEQKTGNELKTEDCSS